MSRGWGWGGRAVGSVLQVGPGQQLKLAWVGALEAGPALRKALGSPHCPASWTDLVLEGLGGLRTQEVKKLQRKTQGRTFNQDTN